MTTVTQPSVMPAANDACWCGSGRKYKRCHKPLEGRVQPGIVSPRRSVPNNIARPPYADSGEVIRQIPSETALKLAQNLSSASHLLFDDKA